MYDVVTRGSLKSWEPDPAVNVDRGNRDAMSLKPFIRPFFLKQLMFSSFFFVYLLAYA